ncbi:MAG: cytochrome c [Nitrospinae bacterium]|nr:cytochrome c [Nitrospinota bacterium]
MDKGRGRIGSSLYINICAYCHGRSGEGKTAIALNNQSYLKSRGDKELRELIAKGISGTAMPGWGKDHGGPLSDNQIDSLVTFIRGWERQVRSKE